MIAKLMDKYKKLPAQVKASFWFLICAFLQRGVSAVTTPIFTRLMTTEEYGQYNVFSSWMSIVTCFVTLNLYGGVYAQGLVKFEGQRKQFASAFQGILATLSAVWLILFAVFPNQINPLLKLRGAQGVLMILIIWTSGVFQLWAQEQRVVLRYRMLVAVTLIYSLLTPALGIAFVSFSEDKVTARVLGMAVAAAAAYGWIFIGQMKRGKVFFSWKIWKYALALGLPLIPHYLSQMILNSFDRIMISRMVGDSEAGIYSLAYSISLIMALFNTSLLSTIEPWVYRKIKDEQVERISTVGHLSFAFIALMNLMLIIAAPEVIRVFAPPEYYEAVWVIPPVTMSVYFMFCYSFFAMFEFYFEKTKYITIATLSGAVANIAANYLFIKWFGYIAAGYTTLFSYMLYTLLHYIFMRKICKESLGGAKVYNPKIFAGISAAFLLAGFCIMATYSHLWIRLGLVAAVLLVCLWKRKLIVNAVNMLIHIRKSK